MFTLISNSDSLRFFWLFWVRMQGNTVVIRLESLRFFMTPYFQEKNRLEQALFHNQNRLNKDVIVILVNG